MNDREVCCEVLGLGVCLCSFFIMGHTGMVWSFPGAWRWQAAGLLAMAFLYAVVNEMTFAIVKDLGATPFAFLGSIKTVWIRMFMQFLLGAFFQDLTLVSQRASGRKRDPRKGRPRTARDSPEFRWTSMVKSFSGIGQHRWRVVP